MLLRGNLNRDRKLYVKFNSTSEIADFCQLLKISHNFNFFNVMHNDSKQGWDGFHNFSLHNFLIKGSACENREGI